MTRFGSGSSQSLQTQVVAAGRVPRVSWCRGVAPLTSERHRLARGRPQAPAGEPRRRCCNTTAPPGAPTTSIGVLVQRWAPIVDATTRRFRRATIDPEQAGSRAATCPRPARGAARRAEEGWHTRRHLWTADWYQPAAVAAKGGSERRVLGRVVPGAGGEAGLQPGRTAGGVSRRARCVARSGPPPPNQCLHFERAAGGNGEVPARRRQSATAVRGPEAQAPRRTSIGAQSADFDFWSLGPPMASRVA